MDWTGMHAAFCVYREAVDGCPSCTKAELAHFTAESSSADGQLKYAILLLSQGFALRHKVDRRSQIGKASVA